MAIQQIVAAMWPAKKPRPAAADQHPAVTVNVVTE